MSDPSTPSAGAFRVDPMELDVTPEPSEEERAAIEAALVDEASQARFPWADAVLPTRKECEKP
jgi:hypothetical protein